MIINIGLDLKGNEITNLKTQLTADNSTKAATTAFVKAQGYLTGIVSGDVTTALGFTPYNSTNPSGYTSAGATGDAHAATAHAGIETFDRASSVLTNASVFSNLTITNGYVTAVATRNLTPANIGAPKITSSTSAPSGGVTGDIHVNTSTNTVYIHDGSGWQGMNTYQ